MFYQGGSSVAGISVRVLSFDVILSIGFKFSGLAIFFPDPAIRVFGYGIWINDIRVLTSHHTGWVCMHSPTPTIETYAYICDGPGIAALCE